MNSRRPIFYALLAVAAGSAVVITSMAVATSGGERTTHATYVVSKQGKHLQLSKRAALRLARTNVPATKEVFLLATRGDRAFYRVGTPPTSNCYGVGNASSLGVFDGMRCSDASAPFIDFSVIEMSRPNPNEVKLLRVEGIAADGVASIGVIDVTGKVVARTPVIGNVYSMSSPPKGALRGLAALDAAGDVLWQPTGPG